jgi:epoxide hydrolase-like predicted phosphatase
MIKNIIFDLGNVLISFKPADFLDTIGFPQQIKNTILNDIFNSSEWRSIDNGDMTTKEAIDAISAKSSLRNDEIARIFALRTKMMFPITGNIKLLPALKKQGFKLFYLSNFPSDIFDEIKNSFEFFSFFEVGIISAEVNSSKPDKRIFEILINKFSLVPEECLFIDDIEENVSSAESIGMKGFCTYESQNLTDHLEKLLGTATLKR